MMKQMISSIVLRLYAVFAIALFAATAAAQPDSTTLWKAGTDGYATYRVPGIVTTRSGVVLAYCGARIDLDRGDWSDTNIVLRRSLDGGRTWEPSRQIAGNSKILTDNIVAIADQQTGDVHFLYQKDYARVYQIDSHDDGKTFTPEREITPAFKDLQKDFPWNVITPGTGHGIQLKSGRLLISAWMANGKVRDDGTRQHGPAAVATLYSDDHGKAWHRGAMVARDSSEIPNPNETVAAQLSDGRVQLNIRSGGNVHYRAVTTSPDGISNWSPVRFHVQLFDPTCDAGLLAVPAAKGHPALLFFSNPDSRDALDIAKKKWRSRENLTVKVSEDNGSSWTHQRVIEPGPSGYSDLAWNGSDLLVIYEAGALNGKPSKPERIAVARLPLAWLLSGTAPQTWKRPQIPEEKKQ